MIFYPLGNRIVVKLDKSQEVSDGGIFLPQNAEKRSNVGVVMAVGEGQYNPHYDKRIPVQVEVGQKVLFPVHVGHTYKSGGDMLVILTEQDVLGVMKS